MKLKDLEINDKMQKSPSMGPSARKVKIAFPFPMFQTRECLN